ncbi:MAG: heterodisulfide reductase [Syntrophobacteraceae bacterium CG2_30_61_12]|nr:MAG: heterodisulfide reductase [Syntrophobacteraceae bacterium CG2_30_61_12]PIU31501.1 MAG: (Fe-S)-binding protein [Syntrophobacteraceae bacterium CG07_land_8_20_14_0_80_61_8]
MYSPKDIIDLLAANVRRTRNPFGVPKRLMNRWWKGLELPARADTLLYTGLMYQAAPYIEQTTSMLERFEDSKWAPYIGYARWMPNYLAGLGLYLMADGKEKTRAAGTLKNIVRILQSSGIRFGYRPELDFYSGILLYDLGDLDGFLEHARFVADRLQQAGVRRLITVDPHTTYALKVLYHKYLGTRLEVKTYFELAQFPPAGGDRSDTTGPVVVHDPCFYGRYLELSEVPNRLLTGLGYHCVPVRNSGPFTSCCGGPAESISPKQSREIMQRRVEELQATGAPIVAMCPICMGNLRKSGAQVEDLSTFLARAA